MATPEGNQNFGWYQALFTDWAGTMWPRGGFELVQSGRALLWAPKERQSDINEIVQALETIAPGFKALVNSHSGD